MGQLNTEKLSYPGNLWELGNVKNTRKSSLIPWGLSTDLKDKFLF